MSSLLELLKAKKADLAAASGNRKKTIKPAEGTGRYRILPSWRGEGQQFWHDFGQHFVKKADGTIAAIYMCTEKTYGRPCDVCSAIESGIKGATDDHTIEQLKEAKSGSRVLLNAIWVDKTPNQVDILELPPTVFAQVVTIMQEWEEAGESVLDLEKGKDFLVSRTGTGLKTKYTVQVAAKAAPLPAGAMSMLNNLDEYVQQESEAQQQRAMLAVRSVSGLLPAPAGSVRAASGLPAAAASMGAAGLDDDDMYAAAPSPVKKAAAPVAEATDVVAKPPKAVAPAPTAPAAAADEDEELNRLIAELG